MRSVSNSQLLFRGVSLAHDMSGRIRTRRDGAFCKLPMAPYDNEEVIPPCRKLASFPCAGL